MDEITYTTPEQQDADEHFAAFCEDEGIPVDHPNARLAYDRALADQRESVTPA